MMSRRCQTATHPLRQREYFGLARNRIAYLLEILCCSHDAAVRCSWTTALMNENSVKSRHVRNEDRFVLFLLHNRGRTTRIYSGRKALLFLPIARDP